jgi:hypothetical protein
MRSERAWERSNDWPGGRSLIHPDPEQSIARTSVIETNCYDNRDLGGSNVISPSVEPFQGLSTIRWPSCSYRWLLYGSVLFTHQ